MMAAAAFSSSILSPTFTVRYVKTVPASVRWTPSTRMSLMVKGSIARTGSALASAHATRRRRPGLRERFKFSAGEESIDVVVEGENGEAQEECQPHALPDLHRSLGDGTPLQDFREIIHEMPAIQQRNGQEIQHAEAHAHESEKHERGHPAELRRLARV